MLQCQQGRLTRQYLLLSLGLHLAVVLSLIIVPFIKGTQKKFIVLGAHSSKDNIAFFRPIKSAKPQGMVSPRTLKSRGVTVEKKSKIVRKKTKKLALKKKVLEKKESKKVQPIEEKKEEAPKQEVIEKNEQVEQLLVTSSGETDIRFNRYQREVQREIARVWRPPIGVPQGTECVLLVEINTDGSIKKFELVTKSKVLVYDLSVLQAAKDFKFNESFWGNSLQITLRQ